MHQSSKLKTKKGRKKVCIKKKERTGHWVVPNDMERRKTKKKPTGQAINCVMVHALDFQGEGSD